MFNIFRRKENKQRNKADTLASQLEIAKQSLISDLETNGIEFLITKMGSNDEYCDLILERRKIDLSYKSEDSVSWYAYRQSDKLHSDKDKIELLEFLANEKYSNYKKYIYCCLASICSNTNEKELF